MLIDLNEINGRLDWLKKEFYLNSISSKAKTRVVRRGEVYWCELGIGIGSEMQKKRPCVIVQNDPANARSPNTIVIPITHNNSQVPWVCPIQEYKDSNGIVILDGEANATCLTSVSKARLGDLICSLSSEDMTAIELAMMQALHLLQKFQELQRENGRLKNFITEKFGGAID